MNRDRGTEVRKERRAAPMAVGTLACPRCDAPVAVTDGPLTPADPLACPWCDHAGAVRDFLSLTGPPRPARVEVRVVLRPGGRRSLSLRRAA